jgi:hypothetical protein
MFRFLEPGRRCGPVSLRERDEPKDGEVLWRKEPELPLRQLEGSLRVSAGEVGLTAMDGDHGVREMVLRHLDAVLDGDVVGAVGMVARLLPTTGPELEPGKAPERAGASPLVTLAPFEAFALEESTGLVSPRGGRQSVDERLRSLRDKPVAAECGREHLDEGGKIARRLRLAAKPGENGLDRAGALSELLVAEPPGRFERGGGVVGPTESRRPGEAAVNGALQRRTRGRLAESFLEQFDGATTGL